MCDSRSWEVPIACVLIRQWATLRTSVSAAIWILFFLRRFHHVVAVLVLCISVSAPTLWLPAVVLFVWCPRFAWIVFWHQGCFPHGGIVLLALLCLA